MGHISEERWKELEAEHDAYAARVAAGQVRDVSSPNPMQLVEAMTTPMPVVPPAARVTLLDYEAGRITGKAALTVLRMMHRTATTAFDKDMIEDIGTWIKKQEGIS